MFRRQPSTGRSVRPAQPGASGEPRGHGVPSLFGGEGGPLALLRQLDEDMNRLFEEFYGGRPWGGEGNGGGWMPQIEVHEREGKLHVCADLPGMRKDDIEVDLADGQLTIQGERRHESEAHDEHRQGFYRSERSYGSFFRSIPLPEGVKPESAQATFRDGVLDISFDVPDERQQRARRLEIRDEAGGGGRGRAGAEASTESMRGFSMGDMTQAPNERDSTASSGGAARAAPSGDAAASAPR